ncbi:hypothetical protein FG386_002889 [Cryptosporidium ryanae]|uniref:uncharacterized protein n=1 Tax=Cryptosporidium ryanae TaxID=515981 RepID=UPI003519FEDD|nr:hypothetical protein FG386_002889 [Cryptosporidium ryanae]
MGFKVGFVYFICLYIGVLVFIGFNSSLSDEVRPKLEKKQPISNQDKSDTSVGGSVELLELPLKFPTLNSFFEWFNSLSEKSEDFKRKNEYLAGLSPTNDVLEAYSTGVFIVSKMVNCLELSEKVSNLYKMSTSQSTSHFFSESAGLSVDSVLQCFLTLKTESVDSYLNLYITLDQLDIVSPIIEQMIELISSVYYACWDIIKVILAYKSTLTNIMEQSERRTDKYKKRISSLESLSSMSSMEMLEKNIAVQEIAYNERRLNLGKLIFEFLSGDFSLSIGISELELLILDSVKLMIKELKDSIHSITESNKKISQQSEKYKQNCDLVLFLESEVMNKEELLTSLKNGPTNYCQKFDSELEATYTDLASSLSESGSGETPESAPSASDAETESKETKDTEARD